MSLDWAATTPSPDSEGCVTTPTSGRLTEKDVDGHGFYNPWRMPYPGTYSFDIGVNLAHAVLSKNMTATTTCPGNPPLVRTFSYAFTMTPQGGFWGPLDTYGPTDGTFPTAIAAGNSLVTFRRATTRTDGLGARQYQFTWHFLGTGSVHVPPPPLNPYA